MITRYGMQASGGKVREQRGKNTDSEASLKPTASSEKPEDHTLDTNISVCYSGKRSREVGRKETRKEVCALVRSPNH